MPSFIAVATLPVQVFGSFATRKVVFEVIVEDIFPPLFTITLSHALVSKSSKSDTLSSKLALWGINRVSNCDLGMLFDKLLESREVTDYLLSGRFLKSLNRTDLLV